MGYYLGGWMRAFDFSGRASRKQYWMFILLNLIASLIYGVVVGIFGAVLKIDIVLISALYGLLSFLPSLSIAVRRNHDTGHSGWWLLMPFYNLYLLLIRGTSGENKYGSNPI